MIAQTTQLESALSEPALMPGEQRATSAGPSPAPPLGMGPRMGGLPSPTGSGRLDTSGLGDAVVQQPLIANSPAPGSADARLDELAEIIRAYNLATDNLQRSHEALRQQVVRLQEQLASADAQLQRSKRLAALGEMAAGIAHEIRNPLAAIQLYAGVLAQDLGTLLSPVTPLVAATALETANAPAAPIINNCVETADKIRSAVRGLDGIVNDVLSFARELAPQRSCVRVASLFDRALDSQRPAIEAAGVKVHHRCVPPDLAVLADSDLLRLALLNLIRNAVQAVTEPPSRNRWATITLAARREDGMVTLTVRDNGPGIAPEHIDRIFNPFFTTRSTGTGLGLAIVHRIVDAHGGTISVHNDHGAVFELRLPVGQVEAAGTDAPTAPIEANEPVLIGAGRNRRISKLSRSSV